VAGGFIHFLPGQNAAFSRGRSRRRIRFPWQVFRVPRQWRAFWEPQRHARPDVFGVNGEQAHFLADLAMVAALGLFDHFEILVELGLVLERGAVDALGAADFSRRPCSRRWPRW